MFEYLLLFCWTYKMSETTSSWKYDNFLCKIANFYLIALMFEKTIMNCKIFNTKLVNLISVIFAWITTKRSKNNEAKIWEIEIRLIGMCAYFQFLRLLRWTYFHYLCLLFFALYLHDFKRFFMLQKTIIEKDTSFGIQYFNQAAIFLAFTRNSPINYFLINLLGQRIIS